MFLRRVIFAATIALAAAAPLSPAAPAAAQEGEARLLFERGNEHLARGMRARGRRRQRELEEALDAYLGVLRLGGRTRNVIFNLALTVGELGREREAFNYFSEYLTSFELSDEDRAEGQRRLEALRPNVAVLEITSTPPQAEVRIDRRDLPVRGSTPVTLAVEPGEHRIFLTREGFEEATAEATAEVGQSATVAVELTGEPVPVQVIAPSGGELTLDGEPIEAGRSIPVAPGAHVVRLIVAGSPPVERSFEVSPGDQPLRLELAAAPGSQTRVAIRVSTEAQVLLDGVPAGHGRQVELPTRPGEHVLQVRAPGHNPVSHRFSLSSDEQLALDVSLGEEVDESGLNAARTVFGVLSIASVLTSTAMAVASVVEHDEYESARALYVSNDPIDRMLAPTEAALIDQADALERLTIATDIVIGVTAALAATAVVLLVVDAGEGEPSTVEVLAGGSPGGGSVSLRGAF